MPNTDALKMPARRRRRILFALLTLSLACSLLTYIIVGSASGRRLAEALAEADRLDPGWRLEELEAKRLPFPAPGKNGAEQVLRVINAMPSGDWPQWPFPQFKDDPNYLEKVRRALDSSFSSERVAAGLLNAEQERVLRSELKRAGPAAEMARQMPDFAYGRWPARFMMSNPPCIAVARLATIRDSSPS